jgi:hypothetical protein
MVRAMSNGDVARVANPRAASTGTRHRPSETRKGTSRGGDAATAAMTTRRRPSLSDKVRETRAPAAPKRSHR